jgi:hypothetical protein
LHAGFPIPSHAVVFALNTDSHPYSQGGWKAVAKNPHDPAVMGEMSAGGQPKEYPGLYARSAHPIAQLSLYLTGNTKHYAQTIKQLGFTD